MEVYAAMLTVMDEGIGRIVAALTTTGQIDNTLILYLQDNGACAETNGREGPFTPRAPRPSLPPLAPAAKQYGFLPAQTRDGWPVRSGYGVMPGPADTYVAYGRDWANVSNTPFREYKHWVHEGGIATPLIVHWPAGVAAARRGRIETQPGQLTDLLATCVDVAGARYPAEFSGQRIHPPEGVSLRAAIDGRVPPADRPLFWEHEGNRAVRVGSWKLVSRFPGDWELYDLATDRAEQRDVAGRHPERVREMAALYDAWARRIGVLPWPIGSAIKAEAAAKQAAAAPK